MCSGTTAIVLLALQCSFASSVRNKDTVEDEGSLYVDERDEVFIDAFHAQGLEDYHSFELISNRSNASNDNAWLATEADEKTISKIISMLNPPGADTPWTWSNDNDHWTFGLVKLTAATAKGSLALHMLHRHGLAPLLAARANQSFESFLETRVKSSGISNLEFFVQSEEEFDEVKVMRTLLENLTLSGLRSLHSFDHQWSVNKFSGQVQGCSMSNGGPCILQAGLSATAHNFLVSHGFSGSDAEQVTSDFQAILNSITSWDNLKFSTYRDFLTVGHTGNQDFSSLNLVQNSSGNWLEGGVIWEDGGRSTNLQIEIDSNEANTILSANKKEKSEYIQVAFERYIEKLTRNHTTFMKQNRLKVWTEEEVQFKDMFERLQAANITSSNTE